MVWADAAAPANDRRTGFVPLGCVGGVFVGRDDAVEDEFAIDERCLVRIGADGAVPQLSDRRDAGTGQPYVGVHQEERVDEVISLSDLDGIGEQPAFA